VLSWNFPCPSSNAWLYAHPIISSFRMASNIFFNIPHHNEHPPSYNSWFFLMHMRPTYRFDRHTLTFLCSWGTTHCHTWCNMGLICLHCLRMWSFMFTQANSCSFSAISLVIVVMSGYCAYSRWYSNTHYVFYAFKYGLLLGLWSLFFSFLCSFVGCFSVIYLFIYCLEFACPLHATCKD
jgi:hypothetical protein